MKLIRKKLESCESVKFKGGQILIHEDKDKVIIEIHTGLGWRMSKWRNPFRVTEGLSGGGIRCDARTALVYSVKTYWQDKSNMEEMAIKRIEDLAQKG